MNLEISQFLNPYDVSFLIIITVSIFFGVKNGIIKSIFNLVKWLLIFYLIKNCFYILRPVVDSYITNQTISDVLIFFFTLITSYILISFINRVIIGIIQPKKSGLVDLSFGAALGILRGYIIFVLIIFFTNNYLSQNITPDFLSKGSFQDIINYGVKILDQMPRNLENFSSLVT